MIGREVKLGSATIQKLLTQPARVEPEYAFCRRRKRLRNACERIGLQMHGCTIGDHRGVQFVKLLKRDAEVNMRFRHARIELGRAAISSYGFLWLAQIVMNQSERVMRYGDAGVRFEKSVKKRTRLERRPNLAQSLRERQQRLVALRREFEGEPKRRDRFGRAISHQADDAEAHRRSIVSRCFEDARIGRIGAIKVAGFRKGLPDLAPVFDGGRKPLRKQIKRRRRDRISALDFSKGELKGRVPVVLAQRESFAKPNLGAVISAGAAGGATGDAKSRKVIRADSERRRGRSLGFDETRAAQCDRRRHLQHRRVVWRVFQPGVGNRRGVIRTIVLKRSKRPTQCFFKFDAEVTHKRSIPTRPDGSTRIWAEMAAGSYILRGAE
jgi:hypothetical protein